jgi:hypothetical protein
MRITVQRCPQKGFTAIAAIFLVLLLAALGGFMLTFSNTQQLGRAEFPRLLGGAGGAGMGQWQHQRAALKGRPQRGQNEFPRSAWELGKIRVKLGCKSCK